MSKYCLDTNVFIQGWNEYYPIDLCPEYWDILDQLAREERIFAPVEVRREIEKIDDDLKEWIQARPYIFKDINILVQQQLRRIMADHPRLVDSIKQRSVADPWVIAFAIIHNAIVVTKETPAGNDSRRIKIPDVCKALGVSWINDFDFARQVGIRFSAQLQS